MRKSENQVCDGISGSGQRRQIGSKTGTIYAETPYMRGDILISQIRGIKMKHNELEVCCASLHDAVRAERGGADRVELNTAIALGGLSCGRTLFRQVRESVDIPIMCMVRCRCGGFYYSDDEIDLMFNQASQLLERGADGIVFGFLNADKTIQEEKVREMTDLIHSYNKPAVFHRAFDVVPDQDAAMEKLIEIGIDRVLTSGGQDNCEEGAKQLAHLQEKYGDRIEILPGGGITADNLAAIKETTGCRQFHSSCKTFKPDYPDDPSENAEHHQEVDQAKVAELKEILKA